MGIPKVSGALKGWTKKRTVIIITQNVVDHDVVEVETPITLSINIQPLPATILNQKTEEERSWKWFSLWIKGSTVLENQDIAIIDGVRYRVMKNSDWSPAGYTNYEVKEDFQ
jgi:hypothetical protein